MQLMDTHDALGGGGSLADAMKSIAVTGISRYIDGALSKKYGLTAFNENQTVGPDGKLRPGDAPAKPPSAVDALRGIVQNPNFIMVAVAVAASIALFIALRK